MELADHDISAQDRDDRRRRNYPQGYGLTFPVADYRPWDIDPEFLGLFAAVRAHTKLDVYRAYSLYMLGNQTAKTTGAVLEVGAWRGGSAAILASVVRPSTVYVADTWQGVVKAGPRDDYYKGGEHADADIDTVKELFSSLTLKNYRLLAGIFPEESSKEIQPEETFSLVHIDVDVYLSAKDATEWVWPRLATGGTIVYDDFGFYGCEGVTAYVHELMNDQRMRVITNLNGQAVAIKLR
ncbi:MAG: TylF/MycF family methyltransferase [Spirochaeta sp.]|nr:TylF/MycF family methyltransferase [Spirochaeta sp.]